MSVHTECTTLGYVLGRAMALVARHDKNLKIDSGNPVSQNFDKIGRVTPRLTEEEANEMGEIMGHVELPLPRMMTLSARNQFYLGFWHQQEKMKMAYFDRPEG